MHLSGALRASAMAARMTDANRTVKADARISELDSLRGIAAVIVMLFHFGWRFGEMYPVEPHLALPIQWGSYGVHLFFAISGFVIFMTLERTKTVADFAVSRFSRLYPVYWACIAITMAVLAVMPVAGLTQPASVALINLSMVQGFLGTPSVDGVYWSLLVELCFYLCMTGLWRVGLLRWPELVLFGWIALKLLWWAMPILPYTLGALLIVQYIPFFAIGMASYRLWTCARTLAQQVPVMLAGLGVTLLVDGVELALVYSIVTAMLIALATGLLRKMSHPALLWLGAISYPLYLLHQNIGYAVITYVQREGVPSVAAALTAIMASLVIAYSVHRLVEQPSLKIIRSWWKSAKARKVTALPA